MNRLTSSAYRLSFALGFVLLGACDNEAPECSEITSEDECSIEGCAWGERISYNDTCEETQHVGVCLAVSGTALGCIPDCEGESIRFVRPSDEGSEMLSISAESVCGPRPDADWMTCNEAQAGACGCTCE